MNTQQFAREGVWIVGAVVIAAIVMLGTLAVVHDGQLAATITSELVAAIQWGLPVLGVLVGVGQLANAYVTSKSSTTTSTTASAATSAAAVAAAVTPAPVTPAAPTPASATLTPAQIIQGG